MIQGKEKKKYVTAMFNDIAERYDLLNHLLSLGIDYYWRYRAIGLMRIKKEHLVLDLASGTGDLAIATVKKSGAKVVGLDIAHKMLTAGFEKIRRKGLEDKISFVCGDGEKMPFREKSFDRAMIAFGIRNMGDMPAALGELFRVLKENGKLMILEFSLPSFPLLRKLYLLYFKLMLPIIGKIISGHAEAYSYLPESVENFPSQREFSQLMAQTGFSDVYYKNFTFGICTAYIGNKPPDQKK
jgi:demethylmenaquinone methyltransferase/2-methoxy-6-polyprenyl-1,4-benzoquinol methylase